ncbi:MAG: winged helix-turn-helix domain-containing protein [Streptosporangiaceae bacterium]
MLCCKSFQIISGISSACRSKGHSQSIIRTDDIAIDLEGKTVEVKGVRIHLTGKEYQMLELLSLRKGVTLTKEMFLNHLYGGMDEPELKIIDVFICKLRKKLRAATDHHHIETVWWRGYVARHTRCRLSCRGSGWRVYIVSDASRLDVPRDALRSIAGNEVEMSDFNVLKGGVCARIEE